MLFSDYITQFEVIDKNTISTISQIVKQQQHRIDYSLLKRLADNRMKEAKTDE